jgi:hypothetical protein
MSQNRRQRFRVPKPEDKETEGRSQKPGIRNHQSEQETEVRTRSQKLRQKSGAEETEACTYNPGVRSQEREFKSEEFEVGVEGLSLAHIACDFNFHGKGVLEPSVFKCAWTE